MTGSKEVISISCTSQQMSAIGGLYDDAMEIESMGNIFKKRACL